MPSDLVLIGTSDPQGICYVEVSMEVHVFGELGFVLLFSNSRSRMDGVILLKILKNNNFMCSAYPYFEFAIL